MAAKMNTASIQKAFKVLGKLIYCAQRGPAEAVVFQQSIAGMVDQLAGSTGAGAGAASNANAIIKIGGPAAATLDAINQQLQTTPATFKTHITNYLQQVMAIDQGSIAGTPVATVGAQLISDMNDSTNQQTVVASGGGNTGGIGYYMATTFGIVLPMAASGSATIPDSWITATPN